MEDVHLTGLMSKLLETKILQVLRFKHGQVYVMLLLSSSSYDSNGDDDSIGGFFALLYSGHCVSKLIFVENT